MKLFPPITALKALHSKLKFARFLTKIGGGLGIAVFVVDGCSGSMERTENGFGVVKSGAEREVLVGLPGAGIFVGRVSCGGESDLLLFFLFLASSSGTEVSDMMFLVTTQW